MGTSGIAQQKGHRRWHWESVQFGHAMAKKIARTNEHRTCRAKDFREVFAYYRKIFKGKVPPYLMRQLFWARRKWPDFFLSLLKEDVLPLDIVTATGPKTVVELMQDVVKIDTIAADRTSKVLSDNFGFLTGNDFGAKLLRGLENLAGSSFYLALFNHRPDLTPLALPSYVAKARIEGRQLNKTNKTFPQQPSSERFFPLRLAEPGFFCRIGPRGIQLKTAETFHRQCWIYVNDPKEVIEYLLSGGELCQALRNNPAESLYSLIKKVNFQLDCAEYLRKMRENWATDGWSAKDKPFISVTSYPGNLRVIGVEGNLFIKISTKRALAVGTNNISMAENEWFVPFIINPAEIVEAKFWSNRVNHFLSFNWQEDFTVLRVECKKFKSGRELEDQGEIFTYTYDHETKAYQLLKQEPVDSIAA